MQRDLRDPAAITACVADVEKDAGGIDPLVTDAAVTVVAPAGELPLKRAQDIRKISFFGVTRLVNALLPGVRDQLIVVASQTG